MWRPEAAGREILVAAAPTLEELEERVAQLSCDRLPPGTRLVLTCGHALAGESGGGFREGFKSSGWSPEMPHFCDPLPGDPRATAAWRELERVLVDPSGMTLIGAVLAKTIRPEELEATTFLPLTGRSLAQGYFPLPEDGHLPWPERVRGGAPFRAGDLAEAFGVSLPDTMPLIDELLASGAITVIARGAR
ncbi:MAG TPA: hypothetical protein VG477_09040 [Thermoanaerobaculia bacterium]|nr:hypothetical protein [Thermoanaerobaculia bacterium]